jgi:hypothetical protein
MPSPFPGMNPYLEHDDAWHTFHLGFATEAISALETHIGDRYYAIARIFALKHRELIASRHSDVERVPYIEVRACGSHLPICVVQLLCPSVKQSAAEREQYMKWTAETISSPAHLIEIDLLRGGRRMPMVPEAPGDYGVLVSRGEDRPNAVWVPIRLRDPLPIIPIPLAGSDPPAPLDLQAILHRIYDSYGFKKYMYQTPPDPPLNAEDAAWARGVLANVGVTV